MERWELCPFGTEKSEWDFENWDWTMAVGISKIKS